MGEAQKRQSGQLGRASYGIHYSHIHKLIYNVRTHPHTHPVPLLVVTVSGIGAAYINAKVGPGVCASFERFCAEGKRAIGRRDMPLQDW